MLLELCRLKAASKNTVYEYAECLSSPHGNQRNNQLLSGQVEKKRYEKNRPFLTRARKRQDHCSLLEIMYTVIMTLSMQTKIQVSQRG